MASLYSEYDADRAAAAFLGAMARRDWDDCRTILEPLDVDDMQAVAVTLNYWLINAVGGPAKAVETAELLIVLATVRERKAAG